MRALVAGVLLALAGPALAVPGPDSTAVVASAGDPESVALAGLYAAARDIPARRVCALDLPLEVDISLADYRDRLLRPLRACLDATGALDAIEAVVLVRGVPLRVNVPVEGGQQRASLAAVLGVWTSVDLDRAAVNGQPIGFTANCGGSPCLAARWVNPFRDGTFQPGWERVQDGVHWKLMLVTRLDGRSYEDAADLVDAALEGEGPGGTAGEFLLMDGADAARGVLDREYDAVAAELEARGLTVTREPFQRDLTGRTLAAFVTGTAGLGQTIEGNAYVKGALTDNLTSLGALPENFTEGGEAQVSIARWVRSGAAGAHGATDEPLNNVFPSRFFLVDHADGFTLAESYLRRMPHVYWRNLVIGDPMSAPYAVRPEVELTVGGRCGAGRRPVRVRASDPEGHGVATIRLLVDGVEVASAAAPELDVEVDFPAGDVQVLAVAQKRDGTDARSHAQPKGWAAVTACPPVTRGAPPDDEGGGACGAGLPLPGLLAWLRLRRRAVSPPARG